MARRARDAGDVSRAAHRAEALPACAHGVQRFLRSEHRRRDRAAAPRPAPDGAAEHPASGSDARGTAATVARAGAHRPFRRRPGVRAQRHGAGLVPGAVLGADTRPGARRTPAHRGARALG